MTGAVRCPLCHLGTGAARLLLAVAPCPMCHGVRWLRFLRRKP